MQNVAITANVNSDNGNTATLPLSEALSRCQGMQGLSRPRTDRFTAGCLSINNSAVPLLLVTLKSLHFPRAHFAAEIIPLEF